MTEVRRMRWWDIPDVHALESVCFPDDAWSIEQFWQELAQPTRCYLVAQADAEILGYGGAFVLAPDSDVQTIAVNPGYRRRGIAETLLDALVDCAADSGASSMLLEVRADNAAAIALYERRGFTVISRRTRYYPDGADALILRRRPLVPA